MPDENERIWVVTPNDGGEERTTRNKDEADRAHAAGHKVESYFPPAPEPDPRAPLHSVSIKSKDGSPYSAEILIDGNQPDTIQAVKVEMGVGHPNQVTLVVHPEELEIDGQFEGWVRPDDSKVRELLEKIRDTDEQTSDGALGSLARRALDHMDSTKEESKR